MREFSIKDLENLSGVKAHTIRMWEQRYQLFIPQRTDTNIRLYSGKDLKSLLNVALLTKIGYRIGKVADMSDDEIDKVVRQLPVSHSNFDSLFNKLKISMLSYDEAMFSRVVDNFEGENGFEATYHNLLSPFLSQIGLLWQTSSICPAHEHFVSHLVKQKICSRIEQLPPQAAPCEDCFVLYLPENEMHDISLLMLHYVLRSRGYKTIYLGQSVPFADLEQVFSRVIKPRFVSIFTTSPSSSNVDNYLRKIAQRFNDSNCHFHFSGPVLKEMENPNTGHLSLYNDIGAMLSSIEQI